MKDVRKVIASHVLDETYTTVEFALGLQILRKKSLLIFGKNRKKVYSHDRQIVKSSILLVRCQY